MPMVVAGNEYTYISRINIPLNNVQDGDIASRLARGCGYHSIFRLEEASHDIQHCCPADGFYLEW